jgi:hypothetical protein
MPPDKLQLPLDMRSIQQTLHCVSLHSGAGLSLGPARLRASLEYSSLFHSLRLPCNVDALATDLAVCTFHYST